MRIILSALLVAGFTAAPALAKAAPTSKACLDNRDIRSKRLSSETGYFAKTSNGWWRNAGAACPAYARNRALMTRAHNDRQCKGDVVNVFDPSSRIDYGACVLGAWEKVADADVPPAK